MRPGPFAAACRWRGWRRQAPWALTEAGDWVAGGRFVEYAVVSGSGRDGGAGPLDAVAHAAADRRRDPRGGVHLVLERLAEAGLVKGKTVGVDATTLEANAAMRSIKRRDTPKRVLIQAAGCDLGLLLRCLTGVGTPWSLHLAHGRRRPARRDERQGETDTGGR